MCPVHRPRQLLRQPAANRKSMRRCFVGLALQSLGRTACNYDCSAASTPARKRCCTEQADRYGSASAQNRYADAYPVTTTPSTHAPKAILRQQRPRSRAASSSDACHVRFERARMLRTPISLASGNRYATQSAQVNRRRPILRQSTTDQCKRLLPVASAQPYRPGGTSTYPGTSASYEVATRQWHNKRRRHDELSQPERHTVSLTASTEAGNSRSSASVDWKIGFTSPSPCSTRSPYGLAQGRRPFRACRVGWHELCRLRPWISNRGPCGRYPVNQPVPKHF